MNEDEDKYLQDTNTDYKTNWVVLAWLVIVICFIAVVMGFVIAGAIAYLTGI